MLPLPPNFPWDPAVVKLAGGSFMGMPDEGREPVADVDYTIYEEDIFVGIAILIPSGKRFPILLDMD